MLWRQQNWELTLPTFFLIAISSSCISYALTKWSAEQEHDRRVDQAPEKFLSGKSSGKRKKELLSSVRKIKLNTKMVLVCICAHSCIKKAGFGIYCSSFLGLIIRAQKCYTVSYAFHSYPIKPNTQERSQSSLSSLAGEVPDTISLQAQEKTYRKKMENIKS